LAHLRAFETREDIGVYQPVLLEFFKLFGEVNCLTSLLKLMITEDLTRQDQPTVEAEETGLVRRLPVIAPQFANPLSLCLKRIQEVDIAKKMAPTDNPWLTSLQAEWVGKILYDGGYFRIVQVQYVPNKGNNRYPCWKQNLNPSTSTTGNTSFMIATF
jgi:hypothetical protein